MSGPAALNYTDENFDNMTAAQFEARLPDLFVIGNGKVSQDPRFAVFLARNPDCAALVRDFEAIAAAAAALFEPADDGDPSDNVWKKISDELASDPPPSHEHASPSQPTAKESGSLDEPSGLLK